MRKFLIVFLLSIFVSYSFAKNPAPLFDNLGNFHHAVSTKNPLAQRYFDQGLVLLYSFEYGEAIRSFQGAIKIDPDCAMCYWGLALALGSKTDMPLNGHELADAKKTINIAMQKIDKQNTVEKLYIAALARRYTDVQPQKMDEFAGLCSMYGAVTGNNAGNYVAAMKQLSTLFPNDADAKTLYAAALFDLMEWNFWNVAGKPNTQTPVAINALEAAMKINPNHPGANHLYVHITEWSPYATKSLSNAKRLHELVPGSEHLAHMPAHTYYSLGHYHDATLANQLAIQIYKNYAAACKAQGFEPEIQYLFYHNYDYLVATASMEGRKQLSLATANELAQQVYPLVEKNIGLQRMLTDKILMPARFGEWQTILQMPRPSAKFQYVLGIWHYARGLAEVNTKQITAANEDLKQLQQITKQGPVAGNLGQVGFTSLQIAENILQGVLTNQAGQTEQAAMYFEKAVKLQDTINFSDPPPWYFPTRQLLGAYLLKTGHYAEAKKIFVVDLQNHPHNGWSLYGLAQSENALGNKIAAQKAMEQFKVAWQYADIKEPVYPFNAK